VKEGQQNKEFTAALAAWIRCSQTRIRRPLSRNNFSADDFICAIYLSHLNTLIICMNFAMFIISHITAYTHCYRLMMRSALASAYEARYSMLHVNCGQLVKTFPVIECCPVSFAAKGIFSPRLTSRRTDLFS